MQRLVRAVALEKNYLVVVALIDGGGKDSAATAKTTRRSGSTTVRSAFQRNMNFSVQTHGNNIKEAGENLKCY